MKSSFFFVTNDVEILDFEETKGKKGARISATFMELNTPSANGRIYRIEEGESIAKSLIGVPIRFGADWIGKHLKNVPDIGIVEEAHQDGNKIKGIVRIWAKDIIDQLKQGIKFLFSVGGVADSAKIIQEGKNVFWKLYNAICSHLQLLPNDPNKAGFPTAKMHKILEINESVILAEEEEIEFCDASGCRILSGIKDEFEEALRVEEALMESIETEVLNRAVLEDIVWTIRAVIREPWKYIPDEETS